MKKNGHNKLNALKTGMYAREVLLPWEDRAEFEKLRVGIFDYYRPEGTIEERIVANIVENRWLRERLLRTTAIATHRHAFGRALEESEPKSWPHALSIVREHNVEHGNALQSIAVSLDQLAKTGIRINEKWDDSGDLKGLARKIGNGIIKCYKRLACIQTAFDEEREFFREYWPKHFEQRIRIENLLDAQFDKLLGRLERVQEARILRDKLRKSRGTGDSSPVAQSHDNIGKAVVSEVAGADTPSDVGYEGLDLDDLDRDDDEWGERRKS